MNFIKMHGLGNDFVIMEVDSWEQADILQPYAEDICNRNFGIGADGLVAIGKDPQMDLFMRIFNPDGSEPEMCGNAIRCVARYAYERKWIEDTSLSVRTLAGSRYPVITLANHKFSSVRVDMGEPILTRAIIPMGGEGNNVRVKINTEAVDYEITAISMGNPHCVIFVDDMEKVPVEQWGPQLETHPIFPAKTNVEFIQVLSRDELIMRVWERGAGITQACGTGACASLVASVLNGHSDRKATIHLLGGDLLIEWNEQDNHVYMSGPATEVFHGSIELDKPIKDMK